ncbi:hypothetical protein [Actinomadura sp. DC4]|uniref:hypothetical protein n=1 Tax=Actinomadura sp. DC4 TaxID=3055069 RepID=UPI0025B141BE|nr:hypothetical protein [Actinomadura sp. DC4]MDN3355878.1 hypothetical protein [Actinomadura sp. DC4]
MDAELNRNDWFHSWLTENGIANESAAYEAAKDPKRLADLIGRAQAQQTMPVELPEGNSLVAGRSLDLTGYLACGHADCLTQQVDRLFSRVWHYFDNIAIVGPDTHAFLENVSSGPAAIEENAKFVAAWSRPLFHIHNIGADRLVTWVAKPPACPVHWKEYNQLQALHLSKKVEKSIASALLTEGEVTRESGNSKDSDSRLVLNHDQLFSGSSGESLRELSKNRSRNESLEMTLARTIVREHWLGTASDLYTASSMQLPVGLGIGLEARLASLRNSSPSTADIAFNLHLPVVDGLPIKELLTLREAERDAFEGFRDSLTQAFKERLAAEGSADRDSNSIAREVQSDVVAPALRVIERRLHAAEDALQKKHHYNIAMAGLSTVCGMLGIVPIATALGLAAAAGVVTAETKFVEEKRDISLSGMYFLWQANEHARKRRKTAK